MTSCTGYLFYNRVVVSDKLCASSLFWNGYYGSILGEYKPRDKDVKYPLELSLIEAMYLVEKGKIVIETGERRIDSKELWNHAISTLPRFRELYDVYKDLRERGFVVRRGLKFGCDYLAYRYGPGIDHAPYGVHVFRVDESFDPIELVRMGRLLHSVRKKLVIALHNGKSITYILLSWWKP